MEASVRETLMHPLRPWLFKTVANELILEGFDEADLRAMAQAGGMSLPELRQIFPDRDALVLALIDEISQAHEEFVLARSQGEPTAGERAAAFIAASLDFGDDHPTLTQVILLALLGSDPVLKERVHENYAELFRLALGDLQAAGVIPDQSALLLSDLTTTLLSLIFLGGCPWLQMDYLSFVYSRNVAVAALEALTRRYAAREHENPSF
jgi:AcrR family transcriptional regulator